MKSGFLQWLRDLPVRRKLVLIVLTTCTIILLLACVALFFLQLHLFKQTFTLDLKPLAEVVAANSAGAVSFGDKSAAEEVLSPLMNRPQIVSATIYLPSGEAWVHLGPTNSDGIIPRADAAKPVYLRGGTWLAVEPIRNKDDFLGMLHLRANFHATYRDLLLYYAIILACVLFACSVVALLLSARLQRFISTPILSLAKTAQVVTDEKNYSIRAPKHANDEIGNLTDAFNHMLATIATRDEAVQRANHELKQRGQELQHELAERRRAQDALHRSEEQWRSLAENAPDTIMTLNVEARILFINRVLPGFESQKVVGSSVYDLIGGDSRKKLAECLQRVFTTGQNANAEIVGLGPDNKLVWYSSRMGPIKSQGRVVAVTLIASDITERKLAETALRESEERYRRFFEEDLTGDYTADPSGRLLTCNPAFASIFAFSSVEEALRGNLAALHSSSEMYQGFVERLRKEKKMIYHEMQLRRMDDKAVFVIQNVLGTFNESGDLVEFKGYVFDITQHKQLEEQFRQAFKMEAVGRLAGGIAHDFNNLLTAILGFSDMLLNDLDPGSALREGVTQIQKAAQQAAALTRQLLAYSRKQVLQAKVIDMNHVVNEVKKMLRRMIGEDIELVTMLELGLGKVKADPSQMEQVIINLSTNARDAMPRGGRLTVRTTNVQSDETIPNRPPGRYILLSINDTGTGMSADVKAHLFEPFFTTKDVGRGTGLGLSTVYGIVKQSGGDIEVDSEPGRGTTFRIYLPRVEDPTERPKLTEPAANTKGGLETVLLVEDEEGVRNLLQRVLQHSGYTVLAASNGAEALRLAAKHPGPIHLLLTDLVMPQMSGRELAERFAQIRPNLKCLYMSGYTNDAIIRHGISELDAAFLEKPFVPSTLLE
ncbi:MAG: PAS domain S-box protein, partial [Verrucomicrobiales bacterium]|nr:PAS domain S-box protein [Verrucomicrobiales bacterium]